jgi:hypothetical protein
LHNIFPRAVGPQRRLSFPFEAVSPIPTGSEEVVLELQNVTHGTIFPPDDLSFLQKGPYRNLPLHVSRIPVKNFVLEGCEGGPAKCITLRLHAGHPVPVRIEAEFGHGETVGGVHTFDVVQKTTAGQVEGGLRVLAVVTH